MARACLSWPSAAHLGLHPFHSGHSPIPSSKFSPSSAQLRSHNHLSSEAPKASRMHSPPSNQAPHSNQGDSQGRTKSSNYPVPRAGVSRCWFPGGQLATCPLSLVSPPCLLGSLTAQGERCALPGMGTSPPVLMEPRIRETSLPASSSWPPQLAFCTLNRRLSRPHMDSFRAARQGRACRGGGLGGSAVGGALCTQS